MGNKQRIADEILNVIFKESKGTGTFVDLFCGSCSVTERVPASYDRMANDKNAYLIGMLKALVDGKEFTRVITKEEYSKYRELYNLHKNGKVELTDSEISQVGWHGWMGSFNGRFFSGGYSGHNVMNNTGKPRDYITEQINNTLKSIGSLKGVKFTSKDYDKVEIPKGSIVYCDIPYFGTKQYETSKDFDYGKFYDWCRANKSEYQIFISEYQMPDDFKCLWQKEVTNSMNQSRTYRPVEKLFAI